jgi:AAA domain
MIQLPSSPLNPRIAHLIAQVLADIIPTNGELETITDPEWRGVAQYLVAMPADDRWDFWQQLIATSPDSEAITMVLASINPLRPLPDATPQEVNQEESSDDPAPTYPCLAEGQTVMALDRRNFGYVKADLGDSARVHFISQSGHEATVVLPKSQLANSDGSPLTEPAPTAAPEDSVYTYATLADIAQAMASQEWVWRGWIAKGVLNAAASEPGVGKTRFGLDLARRLHSGLPFPDGQANEWPQGTRTLWIQGDRNFAEMLQAARDFGLPDEAVTLNAPPEEPTSGLDLDDPAVLIELVGRIKAVNPALVVIDTVGMTTGRNLCRPEEARLYFAPLMDLATKSGVAFLCLTHLSKDKDPLGRRIVEKARVVLKMTCPDPEGQPNRRRLWVDKSAIVKPPPLGVTMTDRGNDYDFSPPAEPEPTKPGRPPEARVKAAAFIRGALAKENDQIGNELCAEFEKAGGSEKTFWRAVKELAAEGEIQKDGGPGTRKQTVLHLVGPDSRNDPDGGF